MRIMRILGLALVAALSVAAFAGVASATAKVTVLCTVNEEVCAEKNTYSNPAFLQGFFANPELPETYAKLEMPGLSTISCGAGKFANELKKTEGAMTGEVSKLFFLSCSPKTCTLETGAGEYPGYGSELEAVGGGNGLIRVKAPRLIASCGTPKFTCTYDAASMAFGVEGGTFEKRGHITSSASLARNNSKSTLGCPATAKFVSRYEINEPWPSVFVTYG